MTREMIRRAIGGIAAMAIAVGGYGGTARAVDPYPEIVKTKSDTDCSGATVDKNIPSGSGTLRFSLQGTCTFLWITDPNAGGPTPVILDKGRPIMLNMDPARKWFEVPYNFPDQNACLQYIFHLTAGGNDPKQTVGKVSQDFICGGAKAPGE